MLASNSSQEEVKQGIPAEPPKEGPRSRSRSAERQRRKPRQPYNQRPDDRRVFKPNLSGGLLSFKQFMELQHFELDPFEAQAHYEEYKSSYERKHLEIFFNEHMEEHWFIEKYDPIISQKWQEERFLNAKVSHRVFIETARKNGFAGLLLREVGEKVEKMAGAPYFGFDPNSMTLFFKAIPVHISRWDLLNIAKTSPGFVSLSMSEPLKSQNFSRFSWVLYDTEEHCNESLELLTHKTVCGDFRLSPVRSQSSSRKEVQVAALQPYESLEIDWRQSKRLVLCLDKEKGIHENSLLISDESFQSLSDIEKEFQLDLQVLYLRKVHAFCYYCLDEYEDERMLAAKCGLAHIRSRFDPSAVRSPEIDQNIENRLNRIQSGFKYDKDNDEELQRMITEFEERNTIEEEEKKVRCNLCKKLFRGTDFMKKHLQNKHVDDLSQVIKKRIKALTLENYIKDPDKMTNQINFAGEHIRSLERRRFNNVKKRGIDAPYEDLDDPSFNSRSKRKLVDYSDL